MLRHPTSPRTRSIEFACLLALACFLDVHRSEAADRADDSGDATIGQELFETHVRPTLLDQCIRCHGEEKQQGGLRLDSREGWMTGGDSGPAIVPGKPDESLLVTAIRYQNIELEMPPKGILPAKTISAIERWIELGAPDPRRADADDVPAEYSPSVEEGRAFWSFQPLGHPEIPQLTRSTWPLTDIDRFVLARLEEQGLTPASDADRETLARRLYFDLIGLPPTPDQIDQFVNDRSPDAYSRLVDRLLDSPHFGERWGRHWLDVVRFAESSGGGRTLLFPNAWRYRDYVVESFNNDLPYDQFVREQIAGDLLEADDWRDRRRQLVATAFLLLGPTNYEMQDKDILEMDVVDEQLDTIGKGMLGMTIGCARCHDHKFDPVPTVDYYAMAGILKSTKAMIHSNVSQWNTAPLPVSPEQQAVIDQHARKLAAAKSELKRVTKAWVDAGGDPKSNKATSGKKSIDPDSLPGLVIDDQQARLTGNWTESTSTSGFVGPRYLHDASEGKGTKAASFHPSLPAAGRYEVQIAFPEYPNRSTRVPVHVYHDGGTTVVRVNQKRQPSIDAHRLSLGQFDFDPAKQPKVVISTEGTEDGVVIADAVIFIEQGDATRPGSIDGDVVTGKTDGPGENGKTETGSPDQARLADLKTQVDVLTQRVKSLEASAPKRPIAMATADDDDAGDIPLAIRGVVHNRGPIIPRGVLQVASDNPKLTIPDGQSGRRELADWIASPDNPLTARVMANRVWHWLIGRGLVPTVDNFGSTGQPPTHPQLLDHLAISLIDDGWSIKSLIRRIVNSRVYQMSSQYSPEAAKVDPDNRLLARMNRKRLRAEDIRDSLLYIGGNLDQTCGGPNIKPGTKSEYGYQFQSHRRSLYVPVFRNLLPELFEVFDFADPNLQQGRRNTSTIASQALLLMNHPFVIEQSRAAGRRLLRQPGLDNSTRIERAFREVLGRAPEPQELVIAERFVNRRDDEEDSSDRWAMLYQTLFQCVDFRYLN